MMNNFHLLTIFFARIWIFHTFCWCGYWSGDTAAVFVALLFFVTTLFFLWAHYILFFWSGLKGFCKAKSFAEVFDWMSPLLCFLLPWSDCIQRPFCRHPINRDPGQQRRMNPKVAYSIGIQKDHPTSAYDWYPIAKILDCLVEMGCWPIPLNDAPWSPHVSNGFRHPPSHELLTFLANTGNLTFIPTHR